MSPLRLLQSPVQPASQSSELLAQTPGPSARALAASVRPRESLQNPWPCRKVSLPHAQAQQHQSGGVAGLFAASGKPGPTPVAPQILWGGCQQPEWVCHRRPHLGQLLRHPFGSPMFQLLQ